MSLKKDQNEKKLTTLSLSNNGLKILALQFLTEKQETKKMIWFD